MRRAAKVDVNQPDIVRVLRLAGASVQHLHAVGQGCPDLAAGFRGVTYLLEVKTETGDLTPDEKKWHNLWRGQVSIVRNSDDALKAIGAI